MKLVASFAAALAAIVLSAPSALADYAPPGTYQQTCTSISVQWDVLSAQCRTRNGNWNFTNLRDFRNCEGDIANIDGRLQCTGNWDDGNNDDNDDNDNDGGWLPRGSYRDTCRNEEVQGATLTAECRDRFGRWRYTELDNFRSCRGDIANIDGMLNCRRDQDDGGYDDDEDDNDGGYGLPGGTWRQSCRNARMYGSVLYSECRDRLGRWRQTSLDVRNCRNVTNVNGQLACSSGGGGGGYGRITLFRETSFSGRSRVLTTDVPDLNLMGFGNVTSSVVVQGGVWQLCDRPNYRGYCVIIDRSQPNLWAYGFNDRAESVRRIR